MEKLSTVLASATRQAVANADFTGGWPRANCRCRALVAACTRKSGASQVCAVESSIHSIIPTSSAHRFGLCRKSSQFKIHLQQRFHPQCVPIAVLENIPTLADCLRQCLDHLGCQVSWAVLKRQITFFLSPECFFLRARPSLSTAPGAAADRSGRADR
jgi:hypothetical protein